MNRYDDPHWYEEKYPEHNYPGMQKLPDQPADDDFKDDYFLPTSQNDTSGQNAERQPSRWRGRFERILDQFLLVAPFVIIAFWIGWFSHQFFSDGFFYAFCFSGARYFLH